MGCAGNFPSHVWLWGWLVFWFGLFFCLRWDGESGFFVGGLCWMGGMGMEIVHRKIVSTTASKIDQQGQLLTFLFRVVV